MRRVITLCGSTKFRAAFEEWNARLTMEGHLVFSVGVFRHDGSTTLTPEQEKTLEDVHMEKISLSDEIFVLDVGGYIGDSTRKEIAWAKSLGKKVRHLSKEYPDWSENDLAKEVLRTLRAAEDAHEEAREALLKVVHATDKAVRAQAAWEAKR